MDVAANLLNGFATALSPWNLLLCAIGVTLGTIVGLLPGIGPAMTIALLLPVTYQFEPTGAFIMFAGIYYGGMYGGSTMAILLNTPGESASIATAVEGFAMAKSGRGGAALATAVIGSFVAGTLSTVAITFVAPGLARVAAGFQPADYFALIVLAFTGVISLITESLLRGLVSLFLGLTIGLIGIDPLTGAPRFTFGIPQLLDGVDVVILAAGLFAVGETLYLAASRHRHEEERATVTGRIAMTREDWARSWKPWLRGTLVGFPLGALPAGGAELPTFLSYGMEKALSKHKDEFGRGAIEGVAGPEAANNAAFSGVLVPLMTLGIPTSATAAILLSALEIFQIQPGPLLFQKQAALVWAVIASLYIGNVMLLVLNLPLIRIWIRLLDIPRPLLYAGILVFATLGVYSVSNDPVDLILLYAVGVLGLLMRRFGIPLAPLIIAAIMAPMAETHLRRALAISQGSASALISRPFSAIFLGLAVLLLCLPGLRTARARLGRRR